MWIAISVFVISYIAIASEKFPRHWVALLGGSALVFTGVLTMDEALGYINWETLGLLAGMFVLASILNEGGFFSWLAMTALLVFHTPLSDATGLSISAAAGERRLKGAARSAASPAG